MGKKTLEPITESMYYVLMCLHNRNMYGTEIAECVRKLTDDRVKLAYAITDKGETLYQNELQRLRKCLWDAQRDLSFEASDSRASTEDMNGATGELSTI